MNRDVFHAIADPTRREILRLVAVNPLNINSVSGNFKISRAAIYKHLKILKESGLIKIKQDGRERHCIARLERLGEVTDWIEQYRKLWEDRLDSLDNYLLKLQNKKKKQ